MAPFPLLPQPSMLHSPKAERQWNVLIRCNFFLALCHTFLMHPYLTHPGNSILLNSNLQQKLEGVGKGCEFSVESGKRKKKEIPNINRPLPPSTLPLRNTKPPSSPYRFQIHHKAQKFTIPSTFVCSIVTRYSGAKHACNTTPHNQGRIRTDHRENSDAISILIRTQQQ